MRFVACLLGLLISITVSGQYLMLVPYADIRDLEEAVTHNPVTIHHIGTGFYVATFWDEGPDGAIPVRENPWSSPSSYYLVWLPGDNSHSALNQLESQYVLLYSDGRKALIEVIPGSVPGPKPFVHGGLVRISKNSTWKPTYVKQTRYVIDTFPVINDLMAMVDTGEFMPDILHLQSYGTRYCLSPQAFEAQNWIKAQFESYPELEVELQDFPFWWGSSSDNVIATLPGKVYPDEYVLVGAHYDSFSFDFTAPGADDNASGTAGVLEIARILSQFEFERSIVFCAFSAEEEGLVGSEYYASHAQQTGMDILGYFNFDMIGYRHQNAPIHTDMIAPASAQELVNFYRGVAAIYLPDFEVDSAQLTGGDSDHTSFNNNGYMGIFPFEDVPNYSPYIHTSQDLVGPSVNSPVMAATFIQANLASVVSLAIPYSPVGTGNIPSRQPILKLYPNPASSSITLQASGEEPLNVTVFSAHGQAITTRTFTGRMTLDVSSWPTGIYLVHAASQKQTEVHRLFIIPAAR